MAVPEPTSTPRIEPSHVSQPVSPRNKINSMKKMDNIMTLSVNAILTLNYCLSAFLAAGRIATWIALYKTYIVKNVEPENHKEGATTAVPSGELES